MPVVPVSLERMAAGALPRVCLMTGSRDDVELVDLRLTVSEGLSLGWSWTSMAPAVSHTTVSSTFRLPLGRAAAARLKLFHRGRVALLLALLGGAAYFYGVEFPPLIDRARSPLQMAALMLGPIAPFIVGVILCQFILRARFEPTLVALGQGWAKLRFPSREAADELERLLRPPSP